MVDARHRFLYINVGGPGRCHDSQIFERSRLRQLLDESTLLKNNSRNISGVDVPVVVIGDSAFKFSTQVMKPYAFSNTENESLKAFNYTLAKSRRVVENAFGHLKARFRRVGKGLDNHINKTAVVITACCILHNFTKRENIDIPEILEPSPEEPHQPEDDYETIDFDSDAELIRSAISSYIINNK
ncbi:putative nuclease HARBI1 [Drosophila sulfurigaster albostrigata]|uniref:putative nuclease HARBI1 n=1 Tax=Drosophila sulfurigaster albostrigata TaxID=89887 RepID=UPI002D21C3DC|nr:putative nuclease HARBI1 [Drosophila sulfurigaster albostrigata]